MTVPRLISFSAVALAAALTASAQQAPADASAAQAPTALTGNVERGRYIVEHVAMCVECHSGRDARGDILPSMRYLGGEIPFQPPWGGWATRAPRNAGLPGYTTGIWFGVLAPAGTPKPVIARLNREIVAILRTPEISQTIVAQGGDVVASTPEGFGKVLREETVRLGKVIRDAGIKPE